jgi:hypothetical protein
MLEIETNQSTSSIVVEKNENSIILIDMCQKMVKGRKLEKKIQK